MQRYPRPQFTFLLLALPVIGLLVSGATYHYASKLSELVDGPQDTPSNSEVLAWNSSSGRSEWVSIGATNYMTLALTNQTDDITTGTHLTFRAPFAMTVVAVRASVKTASTGAELIFDINEEGTSILSTKLSIDATETTSTTAASAAVIADSTFIDDAEISIDVDQVGSTTTGVGPVVTIYYTR